MEIFFRSRKLKTTFSSEKELVRKYGADCAKIIKRRMIALDRAVSLSDLGAPGSLPERCHELTEDRKGQLSLDLKHPFRLIVKPMDTPPPTKRDGGLDWTRIERIRIESAEDTHG